MWFAVLNYQLAIGIANSELTLYAHMISRNKVYNYMITSDNIITHWWHENGHQSLCCSRSSETPYCAIPAIVSLSMTKLGAFWGFGTESGKTRTPLRGWGSDYLLTDMKVFWYFKRGRLNQCRQSISAHLKLHNKLMRTNKNILTLNLLWYWLASFWMGFQVIEPYSFGKPTEWGQNRESP